nr:hypothetical protein [Bacteroidota bacterium]
MTTKVKNLSFQLASISTEQFAMLADSVMDPNDVRIGTHLRYGSHNVEKIISIFTLFKFESKEKPFIQIEVGCHFRIEDKSWDTMYNDQKKQLVAPKGFMLQLSVLTVGTCRGVLHAKTEGTPLNKYFLPTLDISPMVNEDVKMDFS